MNQLADDDPTPVLMFDGPTVTVSDSGRSVTLTPNRLYFYRDEEQEPPVEGVAVLDADGLVMLDIPSSWDDAELRELAASGASDGRALHHVPGLWSAENANRFAERHGLLLSVHRIDRSEYLDLVRSVQDATL